MQRFPTRRHYLPAGRQNLPIRGAMQNLTTRATRFWAIVTALVLATGQLATAQTVTALKIEIVEGDGAINNIKQRVSREPVVQVTDENDRPIGGAIVTFTLPQTGAGGVFANGSHLLTVTTDASGRAAAVGLRPNNVAGNFQIRVTASHQGQTASTSIPQSNAAALATGVSAAKVGWIAGIAAAGATALAVGLTRGGNSTPVQNRTDTPAGVPAR
jgi:hypothetical protein